MEIDHLHPEAHGGETAELNLWLACSLCNDYKNARITVVDPETKELVLLFNPRTMAWKDHFAWVEDGVRVKGLTATGRGTVETLRLNRELLVTARKLWVAVGWHPPQD